MSLKFLVVTFAPPDAGEIVHMMENGVCTQIRAQRPGGAPRYLSPRVGAKMTEEEIRASARKHGGVVTEG